ncbi:hypothetical protein SRHO_G00285670 [Serrasalmus rhombeus]
MIKCIPSAHLTLKIQPNGSQRSRKKRSRNKSSLLLFIGQSLQEKTKCLDGWNAIRNAHPTSFFIYSGPKSSHSLSSGNQHRREERLSEEETEKDKNGKNCTLRSLANCEMFTFVKKEKADPSAQRPIMQDGRMQ